MHASRPEIALPRCTTLQFSFVAGRPEHGGPVSASAGLSCIAHHAMHLSRAACFVDFKVKVVSILRRGAAQASLFVAAAPLQMVSVSVYHKEIRVEYSSVIDASNKAIAHRNPGAARERRAWRCPGCRARASLGQSSGSAAHARPYRSPPRSSPLRPGACSTTQSGGFAL